MPPYWMIVKEDLIFLPAISMLVEFQEKIRQIDQRVDIQCIFEANFQQMILIYKVKSILHI